MKKWSLALGAAAVLASVVASGVVAQGSGDPATVQGGMFKADGYHTQVGFSLSHFGFSNFLGLFSNASGTLQLDPAKPAASKLEISIPIQSVSTTVPKLDEELKGAQWFDSARFPNATFVSTKITPTGRGSATIAGDLTLHGVTKPVTLAAKFVGAGVNPLSKAYTVGFEATGKIKRSDFGVSTYVPMVGDEVQLSIVGAFERQA